MYDDKSLQTVTESMISRDENKINLLIRLPTKNESGDTFPLILYLVDI